MAIIVPRKRKGGEVSFNARVRIKGHPPQSQTFRRKTDAAKWAGSIEAALRESRFVASAESKRHTVAELIDDYIAKVLPAKKDQRNPTRQLEWWKARLGHRRLADVTPALLIQARDSLDQEIPESRNKRKFKKRSPASVVRYMAVMSHAFTVAVKEWQWLEYNPFTRVSRPKEPRGRVRYLSDDERTALLQACQASGHPLLYTAVVLSLSTGARKGELLGLQWKDVDLKAGRITLLDTKNGETRVLPLAGRALVLMQEQHERREEKIPWVFPGRGGRKPIDLQVPWQAALKKAKIADFRWHDLRHSAASYLAMGGASVSEIAEVLGHKQLEMVKRYAHLSPQHVAGVVERMNAKIFGR